MQALVPLKRQWGESLSCGGIADLESLDQDEFRLSQSAKKIGLHATWDSCIAEISAPLADFRGEA